MIKMRKAKFMKKLICIVLLFVVVFVIAACGNSKEEQNNGRWSLALNMSDYASMEKCADPGITLSQNNEQMNTQAGQDVSQTSGKA